MQIEWTYNDYGISVTSFIKHGSFFFFKPLPLVYFSRSTHHLSSNLMRFCEYKSSASNILAAYLLLRHSKQLKINIEVLVIVGVILYEVPHIFFAIKGIEREINHRYQIAYRELSCFSYRLMRKELKRQKIRAYSSVRLLFFSVWHSQIADYLLSSSIGEGTLPWVTPCLGRSHFF